MEDLDYFQFGYFCEAILGPILTGFGLFIAQHISTHVACSNHKTSVYFMCFLMVQSSEKQKNWAWINIS